MVYFSNEVWFLMGILALAAVISFLNTVAAGLRNGTELQDAKVAVAHLQIQYAKHLHELMYGAGVDIVEDEEEDSAPDDAQEAQLAVEIPAEAPAAAQAA